MDNGLDDFEGAQFDDELVRQCDEVRATAQRDWFKPASVSLQKLDQVKARVYNLQLLDAKKLRGAYRNAAPQQQGSTAASPASILSDLHAEPPLSTVSYQKAAWAPDSEQYISSVIKRAGGNVGIKPSRPSSAKMSSTNTRAKQQVLKSRPQSAKDPMCPTGKKKTSLGVKGHRYDPTEKSPSPNGWAGPPAGLSMPNTPDQNVHINQDELPAAANGTHHCDINVPFAAPAPSPVPSEEAVSVQEHSLHLSLALPSADDDAADEMDTGRLMKEANTFVQKQKQQREAEKIKRLRAERPSRILLAEEGASEDMKASTGKSRSEDVRATAGSLRLDETRAGEGNTRSEDRRPKSGDIRFDDVRADAVTSSPDLLSPASVLSEEAESHKSHSLSDAFTSVSNTSQLTEESDRANLAASASTSSWDSESTIREKSRDKASSGNLLSQTSLHKYAEESNSAESGFTLTNSETQHNLFSPDSTTTCESSSQNKLRTNGNTSEEFTHITSMDSSSDAQQTNAGPKYEDLGPPKRESRTRTHPIFLMPENKSVRERVQPPTQDNSKSMKDRVQPRTQGDRGGKHDSKSTPPSRQGVLIREDRNVTVDITPRNLGRKVTDKSFSKPSFVQQQRDSFTGRGEGRHGSQTQLNGVDTDLEVSAVPVGRQPTTFRSATPASTVTVCYDDDNDGALSSHEKGRRKRRSRRPVKEKDLVTMVSTMADASDTDDPAEEVDILLGAGDTGEDKADRPQRPSSGVAFSSGEKNYYDFSRRRRLPSSDGTNQEEKEDPDFITVTTKTILFDSERPTESVVKKILEAPAAKPREKRPSHRPKSATQRPGSANLVMSDMKRTTPLDIQSPTQAKDKPLFKGSGDIAHTLEPAEEERPQSRRGFFTTDAKNDTPVTSFRETGLEGMVTTDKKEEPKHRPPSGKHHCRPASASKTAGTDTQHSRSRAREKVTVRTRPSSASPAVGRSPSAVDAQRANAAVRAMRSEAAASGTRSSSATRCVEARKMYLKRTCTPGSAPSPAVPRRAFILNTKTTYDEVEDTPEREECREIQDRLAKYGIDVHTDTLERALFPPTGKTLYYDLPSKLSNNTSNGLLSHPRYWLPREHRNLKLAEKKLAQVELALWRQQKAEERKARLAASKAKGKKKGKKGKKGGTKLRRPQSAA